MLLQGFKIHIIRKNELCDDFQASEDILKWINELIKKKKGLKIIISPIRDAFRGILDDMKLDEEMFFREIDIDKLYPKDLIFWQYVEFIKLVSGAHTYVLLTLLASRVESISIKDVTYTELIGMEKGTSFMEGFLKTLECLHPFGDIAILENIWSSLHLPKLKGIEKYADEWASIIRVLHDQLKDRVRR